MATINDIGIPLPGGSGLGILQPKLKNRWMVQFVGFGDSGTSSRDLQMQVVTVSRPKITFNEVELHRYNSVSWVAGKHTYDPLTMTVQDNYSNGAAQAIQKQVERQQKLIGANAGQYLETAPDGATYKFAVKLSLLDGGTQVLEEWNYEGCWFTGVDGGELDYSSNDVVTIGLTVRFDNAFQVFTDGNASGQALGGNAAV